MTTTAAKPVSVYQLYVFMIDALTPPMRGMSAKGIEIFDDAWDMAQEAFDLYETDVAAFEVVARNVIALATNAAMA